MTNENIKLVMEEKSLCAGPKRFVFRKKKIVEEIIKLDKKKNDGI